VNNLIHTVNEIYYWKSCIWIVFSSSHLFQKFYKALQAYPNPIRMEIMLLMRALQPQHMGQQNRQTILRSIIQHIHWPLMQWIILQYEDLWTLMTFTTLDKVDQVAWATMFIVRIYLKSSNTCRPDYIKYVKLCTILWVACANINLRRSSHRLLPLLSSSMAMQMRGCVDISVGTGSQNCLSTWVCHNFHCFIHWLERIWFEFMSHVACEESWEYSFWD
jgi:hypothetical protein